MTNKRRWNGLGPTRLQSLINALEVAKAMGVDYMNFTASARIHNAYAERAPIVIDKVFITNEIRSTSELARYFSLSASLVSDMLNTINNVIRNRIKIKMLSLVSAMGEEPLGDTALYTDELIDLLAETYMSNTARPALTSLQDVDNMRQVATSVEDPFVKYARKLEKGVPDVGDIVSIAPSCATRRGLSISALEEHLSHRWLVVEKSGYGVAVRSEKDNGRLHVFVLTDVAKVKTGQRTKQ